MRNKKMKRMEKCLRFSMGISLSEESSERDGRADDALVAAENEIVENRRDDLLLRWWWWIKELVGVVKQHSLLLVDAAVITRNCSIFWGVLEEAMEKTTGREGAEAIAIAVCLSAHRKREREREREREKNEFLRTNLAHARRVWLLK